MRKNIFGCVCLSALAVGLASAAAEPPKLPKITFDPEQPAFKDQRTMRSAPCLGYAGCVSDAGGEMFEEFFVKNPDHTWEVFQQAGAYLVKEWGANDSWEVGRAYAALKTDAERQEFRKHHSGWASVCGDPMISFSWRKKHGVKVFLCLEQYSTWTDVLHGKRSSKIEDVKEHILAYVQWIVDNGFKDQVAGFELGNEPYFGSEPELYAERWSQIVPDIKRIFPEVDIGFSVAEYREGDPDIAAVRARCTNVEEWFESGDYYGFHKINQWSGRFIVSFSNAIDYCSHVIYHFYGGNVADGVGPCGFNRVRHFAKVFPEVKDKRVWITEWRERSDEDDRCQQMHSSAVTKAHFMLLALSQKEYEGINLHSCNSIAGGFSIATGHGDWLVQWDAAGRNYTDPDYTGRPRIEVGPVGPVFKIYNQALLKHPLIMNHGTWDCKGSITNSSYWSGVVYYGASSGMINWLTMTGGDPKKKPACKGNAEWVLTMNPEKTSVALLVCNSTRSVWKPSFEVLGHAVGKGHYRTFRCKEEFEYLHQIPGEPKPTWEEEYDGEPGSIVVPEHTICTIVFPIKKEVK